VGDAEAMGRQQENMKRENALVEMALERAGVSI